MACVVVAYSEVEDQLDPCLCDQPHRGPSTKLPPTARSSAASAAPTASAAVATPAVAAIPAVGDPGRKDA